MHQKGYCFANVVLLCHKDGIIYKGFFDKTLSQNESHQKVLKLCFFKSDTLSKMKPTRPDNLNVLITILCTAANLNFSIFNALSLKTYTILSSFLCSRYSSLKIFPLSRTGLKLVLFCTRHKFSGY